MKMVDELQLTVKEVLEFEHAEILRRKAFLEFDEADAVRLRQIHATLQQHSDDFAQALCTHLMAFEETRSLVGGEDILKRMQDSLSKYFREISEARYDHDYFRRRQQAGFHHQHIGLAPEWYLGIYGKYLSVLLPRIRDHFDADIDGFCATMLAFF